MSLDIRNSFFYLPVPALFSFEELLGKAFREQLGQFLTPRPIVDFMVDILAPCAGERLCDPCCGSGGLLIKAIQFMRATAKPDNTKKRRNPRALSQCIWGTEANPRMARTAKLNMILHGDGHCGILHHATTVYWIPTILLKTVSMSS